MSLLIFQQKTVVMFVCLACLGCSPQEGGDPEVWHDIEFAGTAKITGTTADESDGPTISFEFADESDAESKEAVKDFPLSTIVGLPDDYSPSVGDKLKLTVTARYKRKYSVGPPDLWKSKLEERIVRCSGVEKTSPVVASAGNADVENDDTDKRISNQTGPVKKLIWKTTGGGQITFSIEPDGDGYQVHLVDYEFIEVNNRFQITKENADTFDLVNEIFSGKHNMQQYVYVPKGVTGTWTSITLVGDDDSRIETKNIRSSADINRIRKYVIEHGLRNDEKSGGSSATSKSSEKSDHLKSDTDKSK